MPLSPSTPKSPEDSLEWLEDVERLAAADDELEYELLADQPQRLASPEQLREYLHRRLSSLLQRKQNRYSLRQFLVRLHFADLADVLEHCLNLEETLLCFEAMSPHQAAQVLVGVNEDTQKAILQVLAPSKAGRLVRLMPADDAVDLLQSLNHEVSRRILGNLPMDADTQTLHQLLLESPDTAAGLMSTSLFTLSPHTTVEEALALIKTAKANDFIYYIYLTNPQQVLLGVLSLKTLLLHANPKSPLQELASCDVKTVLDTFDQELVVNVFRKYHNLLALPVVDIDEHLMGIITLDDVVDVIDEESQEDLYRKSGINLEDMDEKNLLSGSSLLAVKARMPWLAVTLLGQLLVASIIGFFTKTVSQEVHAFSFLPLLCGLAGNMGAQSDTITVRGIALGMVTPSSIKQQLWRELRVASVIGGTFSLTLGGVSFLMYKHVELSLLLAVYVVISVCVSAVLGACIPYTIRFRFGQDPAGMGGPFITTTMDLLMYTSYLIALSLLASRMI